MIIKKNYITLTYKPIYKMKQSNLPFKSINSHQTLNIWTWNINCLIGKTKLVTDLLLLHDIDILFLTETKIKENEPITHNHYTWVFNSNKTSNYHGVAFIYKSHLDVTVLNTILPHYNNITDVTLSYNSDVINLYLPTIKHDIDKAHNKEGRIIVLKCNINNKILVVVGTYVPNSGVNKKIPLKRLAYRTLVWDHDLYHYLNLLQIEYKYVIWLGDLNVVIKDNDTHNVKSNIAGTTIEERTNIKSFMVDWIDTWDVKNNIKNPALRTTWVDIRSPLRLDYVICSKSLKNNIITSIIDQSYTGSDHYPCGSRFNL